MATTAFDDVHITILAGGSGTRLWPLSRADHPKQLLALFGETSLLRQTVERVLPLVPWERIYILTGPDHAAAISEALPELPEANVFLEPSPRGTAPCLCLAAMRIRKRAGRGVMISLHADHLVQDAEAFRAALCASVETAREGYLVTVGIVPDLPETGFGYVQRGPTLGERHGLAVHELARFVEKPSLEKAQAYLASGEYFWNSGYFTWDLDTILAAFAELLPTQFAALEVVVEHLDDEIGLARWEEIEPVSIDVGIMEKARRAAVVPGEMGWSDIGSFASLYQESTHNADSNVLSGSGCYVALDGDGNYVHSNKLVTTIGMRDVVIVDTGDALLVMPRSRAQDVSALVRELRARNLDAYL